MLQSAIFLLHQCLKQESIKIATWDIFLWQVENINGAFSKLVLKNALKKEKSALKSSQLQPNYLQWAHDEYIKVGHWR
jgi:hypothetical protein